MQSTEVRTQEETGALGAIQEYLKRVAPARSGDLPPTLPLLDSGILDSLGILQLMAHLSETLQVELSDEDFVPEHFQTIGSLARLVASKR